MVKFTIIAALLVASVSAANIPRQGAGRFITSPCKSDADCDSGCCGFTTNKCAGAVIALQRDGGCGAGNAQPNRNAAAALGSQVQITPAAGGGGAAPAPANNGAAAGAGAGAGAGAAAGSGKAPGTQFITGPCSSDADCASGCCGFTTNKCAGAVIALQRDGGCGAGDAKPNRNAAAAQGSQVQITPAAGGGGAAAAPVNNGAAAGAGSGKAPGTQFITGPCASDADCASGCCGFKTSKCAGAVIALQRDGGCGAGDAQPNRNAAAAQGSQVQITPRDVAPAARFTPIRRTPKF